jgi:hypothetical protein
MAEIPIDEIEKRAVQLHDRVKGMPAEYQSAVIAHLLATWIAGHRSDDQAALAVFREQLLQDHIELVRQIIPLEDARIGEAYG